MSVEKLVSLRAKKIFFFHLCQSSVNSGSASEHDCCPPNDSQEVTPSFSLGPLHNDPRPATTLTMDECYSVSKGQEEADLLHSIIPKPCSLFTPVETCNLIWRDGSVLLPLPCAALSLLHMELPSHPFTCLACLHCAESQNKIF